MGVERDPTAPVVNPPPDSGSTPQTIEPWRAPADHPEPWARGKTAEEILGIGTQAIAALRQLASQPTPQTIQQPAAPAPAVAPAPVASTAPAVTSTGSAPTTATPSPSGPVAVDPNAPKPADHVEG